MCGRTALSTPGEDLREAFGLDETPELEPRYNVPPSQPVAVVRAQPGGGRTLRMVRWGLVPAWATDPAMGHRLPLARIETAATTPAFRESVRRRRCLVVVDAFYEWQRAGKQPSQPFLVRRPDHRPLALAGLWERWVSRDGQVIESCAILTRPARAPVEAIHDRMPVVLGEASWPRWLDPDVHDASDVLASTIAPELIAFTVSPHVNDPRHDDPACEQPWEPRQRSLF